MDDIFLLSPWCERRYLATQNSLLYLKYYMADHGYNSKIIDCAEYDEDYDQVIHLIKGSGKPIIGITAYTRERFHAYRLIKKIRKEISHSIIVTGGRHFGFLAEETLKELPEVDIVVRGEGEITMKEICDRVYKGKKFADVLGISYLHNGEIQHNEDRPLESDLDKFRCFDINDKEDGNHHRLIGKAKMDAKNDYFSVMATRGCPNRCVYCSLTATRVRYRSIDSIIREIEEKINITGVRNVTFADSSLTTNRHFVEALCRQIIEKDMNIRFNCYSRVNIDLEVLKTMKQAGLASVEIGLESGSPRVLKSIKKNIKVDEFRNFCEEAYKLGIKIYVFCMISLPDEKIEDADMTISLIKNLSKYIYYVGIQTTRILPDAALYSIAKERAIIPKNFNWFEPYELPSQFHKIFKDPMYDSIPLYIEHLTLRQITQKLDEYKQMLDSQLSNFHVLQKALKYNLSQEGLRRLTFGVLPAKALRLFIMTFNAIKNRKKETFFK